MDEVSGWGGARPKRRPDDKRGGSRGGARPRLPLLKAGQITIHVANLRAMVVKWKAQRSALVMLESRNWFMLEPEAVAEVEALGGSIFISAQYPCSAELAEKAIFD